MANTCGATIALTLISTQIAQSTTDAKVKTGPEINDSSRRTTILIAIADQKGKQIIGIGSGSIIAKQADICFGLTNRHVVASQSNQPAPFVVRTYDSKVHKGTNAVLFQKHDLAVVQFECEDNYESVTLATYALSPGQTVYVSGWPATSSPDGSVVRQFTSGTISTILDHPQNGYQIGYTNITRSGMSGGQVLDEAGRLVGVHGIGTIEQAKVQGVNIDMKTGFNYGIPVSSFMAAAAANGVNLDVMGLKIAYSIPQRDNNSTAIPQNPAPTEYQPSFQDRINNIHATIGVVDRVLGTVRQGIGIFCGLFRCR
jgi:S1-C subfamily serine protease